MATWSSGVRGLNAPKDVGQHRPGVGRLLPGDSLPRYGACGEDLLDQRMRLYREADHLAGLLADGYHHDCQITAELR